MTVKVWWVWNEHGISYLTSIPAPSNFSGDSVLLVIIRCMLFQGLRDERTALNVDVTFDNAASASPSSSWITSFLISTLNCG